MPVKRGLIPRDNPTPVGHEELTVTSAAPVALAGPSGTPLARLVFDFAWIEVQTQAIRLWVDGGTPTGTSGHFYAPGQNDILGTVEVRNLRAIAPGADAVLAVTYYRELVA